MKNSILLTFISLLSFSLTAQNSVTINFNHLIGDNDLVLNEQFQVSEGEVCALDRCQYYISDITIVHDGGMETEIEDVWLLVDGFAPESFSLGAHDMTDVEQIKFHVGVGPDVNNADPTLWPNDHPLYPQSPSMHWGWSSGYRFIAIEGNSGETAANQVFQIHALGNNNYFETTVDVSFSASEGELNLYLDADYLGMFPNIDISQGAIIHSITGSAITALENFRDNVFSQGQPVNIEEPTVEKNISTFPNPVAAGNTLKISGLTGQNASVKLLNLQGKEIELELGSENEISVPAEVTSGLYVLQVSNQGVISTEKILIQ